MCGKSFIKKNNESKKYWSIKKYCSKECARKRIITEENRENMRIAQKKCNEGRIISKETRNRIGMCRLGKHHTEETRKKISEKLKGKPKSKEHCDNIKKSIQIKKLNKEEKKKYNKLKKGDGMGVEKCLNCGKKISKLNKFGLCFNCKKEYMKKNNLYVSREYHLIRCSKEFKGWRDNIFTTDNWICQKCGKRGYELHPHHILNFNDHIEERFNPNNGITFCVKCHKWFHNIYGYKNNTKEQVIEFIHT
jgi:ribosomal protein S14/DNA-directed RNA polymerase subunit RPC12/RpoP